MSRAAAKAFFDPGPGEPQTGYITPADQQASIDVIYDDAEGVGGPAQMGSGWNIYRTPTWWQVGRLVVVTGAVSYSGTPPSGSVIITGLPAPITETWAIATHAGTAAFKRLMVDGNGNLLDESPSSNPDYTFSFSYIAGMPVSQQLPAPDPDPTPEQHHDEEDR